MTRLWTTPDRRRVFLVPAEVDLPPGDDVIERPFGAGTARVDLAAMKAWEVDGKRPWARASGGAAPRPRPEVADALRRLADEVKKPEVAKAFGELAAAVARATKGPKG